MKILKIFAGIILAAGLAWGQTQIDWRTRIANKPFIDVKGAPYLAKGNGTTNDTAAFNAALAAAQAAGGGTVLADSGIPFLLQGNINIAGSNVTLQLSGAGLNLASGASIVMSGNKNALTGSGTPITATTTAGDAVRLTGCLDCTIKGLHISRSATPAISGAGINIASGNNYRLKVDSLYLGYHYRGIWAQVAPVVSNWSNLTVEYNVTQGLQFDGDNDEHLTNVVSNYNGGHAVQIGKGAATTYCIGGVRITNLVAYANGGDGMHVEGAVASACNYVFVTNSHFDSDTGYELYVKNAGAVSISNSQFINGKGVWIGDGATGIYLNGLRMNGSSQEGLYLTNGATRIFGSGLLVSDHSLGNPNTYYGIRINNGVTLVNISGVEIGSPDTTAAGGLLVEVGTGAPSYIHLIGTQLFATGNMVTPVSIAGGLTDVVVNYGEIAIASMPEEALNVKAYGAKGDGATDDTAAFQAAIDSATSGTSVTIVVPNGDYHLHSSPSANGRFPLFLMYGTAATSGAGVLPGGIAYMRNGLANIVEHAGNIYSNLQINQNCTAATPDRCFALVGTAHARSNSHDVVGIYGSAIAYAGFAPNAVFGSNFLAQINLGATATSVIGTEFDVNNNLRAVANEADALNPVGTQTYCGGTFNCKYAHIVGTGALAQPWIIGLKFLVGSVSAAAIDTSPLGNTIEAMRLGNNQAIFGLSVGGVPYRLLFMDAADRAAIRGGAGGVVVQNIAGTSDWLTILESGPAAFGSTLSAAPGGTVPVQVSPPANDHTACVAKSIADDANYHYYCVATDTWVRVAWTAGAW